MRRPPPLAESRGLVSPDGAWYWDGSVWRSGPASPWRAPPIPNAYPLGGALRILLIPLALVAEILARGFGRALSLVIGILSWGVTIALLVWLFHH